MRLPLLIIALTALTLAQATQPGAAAQIINLPDTIKTTIDDISYTLVKQRIELPTITLPLPAAAYKDYGNIKLVVIAIPYSPDENFDQLISDAIKQLLDFKSDFKTRISNAVQKLLSIRSVFYPYETFKVRVIFIIFIHTQTLIDYAIESSKDLLSTVGSTDQKAAGAALYTNTIMEILKARYQDWQTKTKSKIEQEINSIKLQANTDGNTTTFEYANGLVSVTVQVTASSKTDGEQKITKCELSSNVNIIENFTNELATRIYDTLPRLEKDDVKRVFAGVNDIDQIFQVISNEINTYYNNIIYNKQNKYHSSIVNNITGLLTIYGVSCGTQNCNCEDKKHEVINNLISKKEDVENVLKKYSMEMLEEIDGTIGRCLGVVDTIHDSLLNKLECTGDICNEIRQTFQELGGNVIGKRIGNVAGACVGEYLGAVAQAGINSVVSTIPGANLVYILANGIMGALQNQVIIEGTIVSAPVELGGFKLAGGLGAFKIYNVSDRVACHSTEVREISGQKFLSKPSTTEAILAGLKGFASAVAQLYATDGGVVDLIPIIRMVDIPENGYFMFTATPGIYVLSIDRLTAKSIVDKFKESLTNTIKQNLRESYENGSSCELYKNINSAVQSLNIAYDSSSRDALYNKAYEEGYDYGGRESDSTPLTLNMYFVVVPPYMAGGRFGSTFNYTLVADVFGLLRSFLFPGLGGVRHQILTTLGGDFCKETSGSGGSTSIKISGNVHTSIKTLSGNEPTFIIGQAIYDACSGVINTVSNIVDEIVNETVDRLLKHFTATTQTKDKFKCDLRGILVSVAESAVGAIKDTLKSEIREMVGEYVVSPLSQRLQGAVCGQLSSKVGGLVDEKLSSVLGQLFGLFKLFDTQNVLSFSERPSSTESGIKGAFCELLGSSQMVSSVSLYVTKVFDAVEEGLYVPSYFLSAYPIRFKESPTARWCYAAVASPYYLYVLPKPPTSDAERKRLLVQALEVIRADPTLQDKFYSFLQSKKVQVTLPTLKVSGSFPFFQIELKPFTWNATGTERTERMVACDLLSLVFLNRYKRFSECLAEGKLDWTINALTSTEDNVGLFDSLLLMLRGWRSVDLPVLVGVNRYFDAFKVYPAIAVREANNPNPYYFVVPFSTPARELFVLGTVGDVVVYDGLKKGEYKNRVPFLYVDVSR